MGPGTSVLETSEEVEETVSGTHDFGVLNPRFTADFEEGRQRALSTGQPLLLFFGSEACHWCRKFHEDIWPDDRVVEAMGNYVGVVVDFDAGSPLPNRYRVRGTPTVLLVDPETGEAFRRLDGYPNPERVGDPAAYFAEMLETEYERYTGRVLKK